MKAISTLVALFLIGLTAVASAILFINESYNFSAALWIIWLVSLTLWIRSMGWMNDDKHTTQNA